MADTKITSLQPPQVGYPVVPATDVLPIVVIADPGMATSGSTRKVTVNQILGAGGTATLASATITGDLTVDTSTLKVNSTNDRVGIGTASPGKRCEINQSANTITTIGAGEILRLIGDDGNVVSRITEIGFGSGPTGATYAPVVIGAVNTSISGFGTKDFYVATRAGISDVAPLERYRIDSTGISTWSVAGTTAMTLNSTGLGVGGSVVNKMTVTVAPGTTTSDGIRVTDTTRSIGIYQTGSAYSYLGIGANQNLIYTNSARLDIVADSQSLFLRTGTNNYLNLDTSGNVGIGVTPSAWSASFKSAQVGSRLVLTTTGSDTFFGNNFYNDGAYKFINADFATYYDQTTGKHVWGTSTTSGAVNGVITWNPAMTLDASGNLLVGLASNPNTARAYFRYDTLTTQPVINSASVVAASTSWSHFIGQSGNGSSITTSNIFIYGNGNIQNVNGVYGTISDLRLKENIADARNYLSDLLKLRVVKYSLKEEASIVANKLGFIAQEVEQVFPAMVDTDPNDGNKGIKTSVLIPMLVKAIQELTARVQTLESR